ncbi:MAG: glutamate 5-kinase [Actinobacteria bacterium]|nr:MAG: glutamate 5-kinase [Actinomycetota bacterium]
MKRIVIKIGTSIITKADGRLDKVVVASLASQIAALKNSGKEIILVTSGAIAAGLETLGLTQKPSSIPKLQAIASVGQNSLMDIYAAAFSVHGLNIGQILLTYGDMLHRESYLNATNTFNSLIELKAIPVVNENDTVAVNEIVVGDNDTLAGLVCNICDADSLIILSDVDGLYEQDPKKGGQPKLISKVKEITKEIEGLAGGASSGISKGGMVTKLWAARIATMGQTGVYIANGHKENILLDVVFGKDVGTYFEPLKKKVQSRKLWIAFATVAKGKITIDEGAKKAIVEAGSSLLPVGVTDIEGDFEVNDAIDIVSGSDFLARGLSNYSSRELKNLKDLSEEAVHRDSLVVIRRS